MTKKLTKVFESIKAIFPELEEADLIRYNDKTAKILGRLKETPEALKFFQPIQIQKPFVQQLTASLLLCSTSELKELIDLKTTPALWIMIIKIIVRAIQKEDLVCLDWLLNYAYGQTDIQYTVKNNTVVILPDVNNYTEADVINSQNKLQNIQIKDYENTTK